MIKHKDLHLPYLPGSKGSWGPIGDYGPEGMKGENGEPGIEGDFGDFADNGKTIYLVGHTVSKYMGSGRIFRSKLHHQT